MRSIIRSNDAIDNGIAQAVDNGSHSAPSVASSLPGYPEVRRRDHDRRLVGRSMDDAARLDTRRR
jgi:hypothetical protein